MMLESWFWQLGHDKRSCVYVITMLLCISLSVVSHWRSNCEAISLRFDTMIIRGQMLSCKQFERWHDHVLARNCLGDNNYWPVTWQVSCLLGETRRTNCATREERPLSWNPPWVFVTGRTHFLLWLWRRACRILVAVLLGRKSFLELCRAHHTPTQLCLLDDRSP